MDSADAGGPEPAEAVEIIAPGSSDVPQLDHAVDAPDAATVQPEPAGTASVPDAGYEPAGSPEPALPSEPDLFADDSEPAPTPKPDAADATPAPNGLLGRSRGRADRAFRAQRLARADRDVPTVRSAPNGLLGRDRGVPTVRSAPNGLLGRDRGVPTVRSAPNGLLGRDRGPCDPDRAFRGQVR